MVVKTEGEDVVINKYILLLIITILGGGGVFTGYATKIETVTVTRSEISEIINTELEPVETKINRIDIKTEGIAVLLREHERRLNNLER